MKVSIFSLSHNVFFLSKINSVIEVTLTSLPANAIMYDMSKILSRKTVMEILRFWIELWLFEKKKKMAWIPLQLKW